MPESLDVRLVGRLAGTLDNDAGSITFTYDEDYQVDRATPPLSVSMPKIRAEHGDGVAAPWIDNLLPDNDAVRQRWASDFGIRRPTAFNLLRHTGEDCAGAVQIVPTGYLPADDQDQQAIDDAGIEARLRALRRDDTEWTFADHGGKWSLGGQQGKFALARDHDGHWWLPTGRAASTHIFKVGIAHFEHADAAEFVSMRAAHHLGLPVAQTQLRRFGDETALIVRRFDRSVSIDGMVERHHQEDLCQALGLYRSLKYQSDGGPSVRDVNALITRDVDPRDWGFSRETFARAVIYSWLTVGTDAHAKNYSLLHIGSRTLLAPLYDLTSAALLEDPNTVYHRSQLAMKIGGAYRVRNIGAAALPRAAVEAGVAPDWFVQATIDFYDRLPDAVREAIADAGDVIDPATARLFEDRIQARWDRLQGVIGELRGTSADPQLTP